MKITRRHLYASGLTALGALGLAPLAWSRLRPKPKIGSDKIGGELKGANSALGHRLRQGHFPPPAQSQSQSHEVVIIGAGISGLAAGYNLIKSGIHDVKILELENQFGGNAQGGQNAISAYPWGAHYVPLLSEESGHIQELFEDFGIITGYSEGLPVYNEDYIINDPDERLFIHGRWQDGLMPVTGITEDDQAQYKRFLAQMETFRHRRGADGRRWFAIPVDASSSDPAAKALDHLTMKAWMQDEGYSSEPLQWFVNYGCRDDFGVTFDEISAYAGIHYFAGRNAKAANMHSDSVLTWPEGNGFLAKKLAEPLADRIIPEALTYTVRQSDNGVEIDYWDYSAQISRRLKAKAAIIATPRFISQRLTQSLPALNCSYAPWAVANISLRKLPAGNGAALSWDNVIYNSPTLGYVVATHQIPQMQPLNTVITYYWPLTHLPPSEARKDAQNRPYEDWRDLFLEELLRVHPELKNAVERVDIWLWGHAMVRPVPGFIWGDARQAALEQTPPIFTAHSDMSGMSIFEEAYSYGLKAAQNVMTYLR